MLSVLINAHMLQASWAPGIRLRHGIEKRYRWIENEFETNTPNRVDLKLVMAITADSRIVDSLSRTGGESLPIFLPLWGRLIRGVEWSVSNVVTLRERSYLALVVLRS